MGIRLKSSFHVVLLNVLLLLPYTYLKGANTIYYYKGSGGLNVLSSWGTNTNGSGFSPTSFSVPGQSFVIVNTNSVTLNSTWSVSGGASKIIIGAQWSNPLTLIVNSSGSINGLVDINKPIANTGGNTLIMLNNTPPSFGTLDSFSTVTYNSVIATTVVPATYWNLALSNSTKSATGNITVRNNLSLTACTFQLDTFTLSGIDSASGDTTSSLITNNSGSTPIPYKKHWPFEIMYSGVIAQNVVPGIYTNISFQNGVKILPNDTINIIGAFINQNVSVYPNNSTVYFSGYNQTIPLMPYYNLSVSGGGIKMASFDINISNMLSIGSMTTLNLGSTILSGTFSTSGNGVLKTEATGTLPIPKCKTWTFDVEYTGSAAQLIVGGTYKNLILSGSRGANNITLDNIDTIYISDQLIINTSFSSGTFINSGSTINFNGSIAQSIPKFKYNNLIVSGVARTGNIILATDTIFISGSFLATSTFGQGYQIIVSGNTINFNGTGTGVQEIPSFTFHNLVIDGASTKVKRASGNLIINNVLIIKSSRILDIVTYTLSGSFTTAGVGILKLQGSTSFPEGKIWNFTIDYNSSLGQNIIPGTYEKLIISNHRNGNVQFQNNGVYYIKNSFTPSSTFNNPYSYEVNGSTIDFTNGSGDIPSFAYYNLTCSGATTDDKIAKGNIIVNGMLTIKSGIDFDLDKFTLSGLLIGTAGNGNIIISGSSTNAIPVNKTWMVWVVYNGQNQSQYIVPGTYNNLSITGSYETKDVIFQNNSIYTILGKFLPLASFTGGKYVHNNCTIKFSGNSGNQNIPQFVYYNIETSGGGTKIFGNGYGEIITIQGTFIPGLGITHIDNNNFSTVIFNSLIDISLANLTLSPIIFYNLQVNSGANRITFSSTLKINGSLSLLSGTIILSHNSTDTLFIQGDFIQNSGTTFQWKTGTTGNSYIYLNGNFIAQSGSVIKNASNLSNGTIVFCGTTQQHFRSEATVTQTNYVISTGSTLILESNLVLEKDSTFPGSLIVNSGGVLNCQGYQIESADIDLGLAGATIFHLMGGGTLITSCTNGINGIFAGTGTIKTFSSTANYEFYGNHTGTFITTPENNTVNDFTVGNLSGVTLGQNLTINGKIKCKTGKLMLNHNSVIINGGISGEIFIAGSLASSLAINGSDSPGSLYHLKLDSTRNESRSLKNLIINRQNAIVLLTDTLEIYNLLNLTAGTLNTLNKLILRSSDTSSAMIGPIAGSGDIVGQIRSEIYIPAGLRRYRMISSHIGNFTFNQYIDDIFISGIGGRQNGFDSTSQNQSTIYTYQESTIGGRGWKPINNINNNLVSGLGSIVFVRGNRSIPSPWWLTPYPSQNSAIIDFTGYPNKGNISPPLTYTNTGDTADDGWNLLGNPYPCPIDWKLLSKTNLSNFYYILDPSSGSYKAFSLGDNNTTIASGQSFFVKAISGSPSILFNEASKCTIQTRGLYKTQIIEPLKIVMRKDSLNSDELKLRFDSSSALGYYHQEDAIKMMNSGINFGHQLPSSNIVLQYSTLPLSSAFADTVDILASAAVGNYSLEFSNLEALPPTYQMLLQDNYTRQIIPITSSTNYSFQIDTNPSSMGRSRFKLIFKKSTALHVRGLHLFTPENISQDLYLMRWSSLSLTEINSFYIEQYVSNNQWNIIDSFTVNTPFFQELRHFQQKVKIIPFGNNYIFRVKQINIDNTLVYSNIVSLEENSSVTFSAFPNPTKNRLFISVENSKPITNIVIINSTGLHVKSTVYSSDLGIDISELKAGNYFLLFYGEENSLYGVTKFTKSGF